MKMTIDLPDELVTEIKIEAARQKRKLKELVPELVRAGLSARRVPGPQESQAMAKWLVEWVKLGEAATRGLPAWPTTTEILAADRGRLDRQGPVLTLDANLWIAAFDPAEPFHDDSVALFRFRGGIRCNAPCRSCYCSASSLSQRGRRRARPRAPSAAGS